MQDLIPVSLSLAAPKIPMNERTGYLESIMTEQHTRSLTMYNTDSQTSRS
jgi:hypothetical protein